MTLLYDGHRLLFAKRVLPVSSELTLRFPFDGTLLVGGTHRLSTEKGRLSLPLFRLREGRNTLLFRAEGRTIPVEALVREGDVLRPAGFPLEETAVALLSRLTQLEAQVAALQEQEAGRADPPSPFS